MEQIMVVLAVLALYSTPAIAAGSQMSVIASYYGNELRGHRTANGEIFNPDGHTAAHRSYPFGTCLTVSYGGRSVNVRVNDRGPFVAGRSIDLSAGAARAIGMPGVARVNMHVC